MDNLHSGPRFVQSRVPRVQEDNSGFIPRKKWLVDYLPYSRGFRMGGISVPAQNAVIPPVQQQPLVVSGIRVLHYRCNFGVRCIDTCSNL